MVNLINIFGLLTKNPTTLIFISSSFCRCSLTAFRSSTDGPVLICEVGDSDMCLIWDLWDTSKPFHFASLGVIPNKESSGPWSNPKEHFWLLRTAEIVISHLTCVIISKLGSAFKPNVTLIFWPYLQYTVMTLHSLGINFRAPWRFQNPKLLQSLLWKEYTCTKPVQILLILYTTSAFLLIFNRVVSGPCS